MRELVLLLDEWNNDKNFVLNELELIKSKFNVTVVCNDSDLKNNYSYPDGVKFIFYKRNISINILFIIIRLIFDMEFWREIRRLQHFTKKISKISEIIRFYINAELFYFFLKKENIVNPEIDTLFYSYWYFWKCFAITKHRKYMPNINVITRTHEYDLFTVSIPSGYQPFKYSMDKNLDKIIFISEHGRNYYLERYFRKESELDYKYIVDNSKYLLYRLGTEDYHHMNPYNRTDLLTIVSCSSIIPRKRVEIIVDAISCIDDIKISWIHFGDGELMEDLRNRAETKLKSKDNVQYELKGYTEHDKIMKYYLENSIDAFVMVAVSEGNPVSVMEAMSFGIPIISYNICNMSNIVKGCGILLPEESTFKALSESINNFAREDDEVIKQYRKRAREIWEEEFRGDTNSNRFINEVLLNL